MKKLCKILASIVITQGLNCQTNTAMAQKPRSQEPTVKIATPKKSFLFVSDKNFNEVFNNHVSYVLTGDKNVSSLGSYISVNPTKPTATVSFAQALFGAGAEKDPKKKETKRIRWILTGTLTGGVTDNVVSVFNNDRFSTSVEGRVGVSRVFGSKFYYFDTDKTELDESRNRLTHYYDNQSKLFPLKVQKLREDIALLGIPRTTEEKIKLTNTELELENLEKDWEKNLNKKYKDSLRSIEVDANWSTIRIAWWDAFAQVKQQKLFLYDTTKTFTKRIDETDFTGYKVGAGINVYWDSRTKYGKLFNGLLRAEYGFSRSNNVALLTPFDVSTSSKTDSSNFSRTITEKASVYDVKKYNRSYYHDIRLDAIKTLSRRAALHVNYNLLAPFDKTSRFFDPKFGVNSITTGFILAFTNKDDTKSKLNVEPYVRFRDLSNKYKSDFKRPFQRNEIGVYLTLPIAYRLGRVTDK